MMAVYLVTGASQGIGLALVKQLSERPDVTIFAGVRSLPLSSDSELHKLATKQPEVVIPILITAGDENDNKAAAEIVKARTGKVDVLIANSGSTVGPNPMSSLTPEDLLTDFKVNTIGPVVLFNTFSSLLLAANKETPGTAKFVVISTLAAQITNAVPFPLNSYAASKIASNFLTKKIDMECPEVIAFPIHPGQVNTNGSRELMAKMGMTPEDLGAITTDESAKGVLDVIDIAIKESHGGKFWDNLGALIPH